MPNFGNINKSKVIILTKITLALILISMPANTFATASLPVHNINTGLDYATIQEAIDAAETLEGHTIKVDPGTFHERLVIWKDSLTLLGENPSTTIIDSELIGKTVYITANNIHISGFTIRNGGAGVYLYQAKNNTITGNIVANNAEYGIYADYSDVNTVRGNTITNSWCGILLWHSSGSLIYHNNFIDNAVQVYNEMSNNTWDNGYPAGGNHWSDHVCAGNPSDGSQPYIIDENNIDHYPFQDPYGWLPPPVGGIWVPVDKFGLLTPYIALASTILVATAAIAIYVKHGKREEKKNES